MVEEMSSPLKYLFCHPWSNPTSRVKIPMGSTSKSISIENEKEEPGMNLILVEVFDLNPSMMWASRILGHLLF